MVVGRRVVEEREGAEKRMGLPWDLQAGGRERHRAVSPARFDTHVVEIEYNLYLMPTTGLLL